MGSQLSDSAHTLFDSPDSHVALCDWLGVHPCGCELGECRCAEPEDDTEVRDGE